MQEHTTITLPPTVTLLLQSTLSNFLPTAHGYSSCIVNTSVWTYIAKKQNHKLTASVFYIVDYDTEG